MLQHAKGSHLDCSFRTVALCEIRVDRLSTLISRRAIVLQLIELMGLKKVAALQQAHTSEFDWYLEGYPCCEH